jgi:hypothetical protein
MRDLSGLKAADCTRLPSPRGTAISLPVAASRTRAVWRKPSGLKAADITKSSTISTRFCGSRTPLVVGKRLSFSPRPLTTRALRGTPIRNNMAVTCQTRRAESRWL